MSVLRALFSRPRPVRASACTLVLAGLLSGCGDSESTTTEIEHGTFRPLGPAGERHIRKSAEPLAIEFGVVPHGETRVREIDVPLPPNLDVEVAPLAFNIVCGCVNHRYFIQRKDGSREEHAGNGLPNTAATLHDGDTLRLEITLLTGQKDVEDVAAVDYIGQVVLQEENGSQRWYVPVHIRYGVDSPITLKPFSRLDFGPVPRPRRITLPMEVHIDEGAAPDGEMPLLREPRVIDTDGRASDDLTVKVQLPEDDGPWQLDMTFEASGDRPNGPFMLHVLVPTNLKNDYLLRIPVSGHVTDAVQVSRPGTYSFGNVDFTKPTERTLVVTDHDHARDPDFVVTAIRDGNGNDSSEHFNVTIEPLQTGGPRARAVRLDYLGTLPASDGVFRGTVDLAKTPTSPPVISLDFQAFHKASREG